MPEPEIDPQPEPRRPLDRLKAMPRPTRLLLVTGVVLAILFVFFQGCSGVEISEEDAVATARAEIGFEPDRTHARVLRQGIPAQPVWVVVFIVQDPEGGRDDYLHHVAVRVHASTGEMLDVEVFKSDGG